VNQNLRTCLRAGLIFGPARLPTLRVALAFREIAKFYPPDGLAPNHSIEWYYPRSIDDSRGAEPFASRAFDALHFVMKVLLAALR
jgi:hypothetical protein